MSEPHARTSAFVGIGSNIISPSEQDKIYLSCRETKLCLPGLFVFLPVIVIHVPVQIDFSRCKGESEHEITLTSISGVLDIYRMMSYKTWLYWDYVLKILEKKDKILLVRAKGLVEKLCLSRGKRQVKPGQIGQEKTRVSLFRKL